MADDPQRWQRIKDIFAMAVGRAGEERAAIVRDRCAGDAELQREVESLLSAHEHAGSVVDRPALDAVAAAMVGPRPPALRDGDRLGPYRIIGTLGAGGMGDVYRARDSRLARDVAVKVLPPVFTGDAERRARFEREARLLASLNHPHIAAIYGVEDVAGASVLVLELVDGPTLAERLAAGPLPVPDALTLARQVADALEAAHRKGIIHRDLKPANITLTPEGLVKVLDFGLAKAIAGAGGRPEPLATAPTGATSAGLILGTAAYMSPEQARGAAVDTRTDIWAFGCVLYEMVTARVAFAGETTSDTLAAILDREPDWTRLPATTPPGIRRLLRRCLAKDPKRRLHDIADARLEIDDALAGDRELPPSADGGTRARVLPWIIAGALAAGLGIVAVPAVRYLRQDAPEPFVTRLDVITPAPPDSATLTPGRTGDPSFALSPDGRRLVFAATVDGVTRLWLRPLDQGTAQPLPGSDGAAHPFWAPDGRAIAFFADGKLKRLDFPSDVPRELADAPESRGGAWGPDGSIIFTPAARAGLMRVPAIGGATTVVTALADGEASHRWPQFLPDGKRFLFLVATPRGREAQRGLYVGSLDGAMPRRIVDAVSGALFAPPDWLLLIQQGTLVAWRFDPSQATVMGDPIPVASNIAQDGAVVRHAFSVSTTNSVLAFRTVNVQRRQLVWKDRSGRSLGTIAPVDGLDFIVPALSPDGKRLAMGLLGSNPDVWLMDVTRPVPTRLTTHEAGDQVPVWSPDGRQVVFRSYRNGPSNLFVKGADGVEDEQLLLGSTTLALTAMDWSRNGLLLYGTSENAADLLALPLEGDRKPVPIARTRFVEENGQFSPDARWVAFQSNEPGQFEIFVQAFPAFSEKVQVSVGGGIQPRWAPDGRELFYVAPDGRLMAVPIRMADNGRRLEAGIPEALFDTDLAAGALNNEAQPYRMHRYAVAPDGRFLLNTPVTEPSASSITVVVNWAAQLAH